MAHPSEWEERPRRQHDGEAGIGWDKSQRVGTARAEPSGGRTVNPSDLAEVRRASQLAINLHPLPPPPTWQVRGWKQVLRGAQGHRTGWVSRAPGRPTPPWRPVE